VGLSMIWLVRILWFMLIGGWGRRRIQARLEAGLWPWKTEAKGYSKNWNLSVPLLPTPLPAGNKVKETFRNSS
jgi:hypothetical protein